MNADAVFIDTLAFLFLLAACGATPPRATDRRSPPYAPVPAPIASEPNVAGIAGAASAADAGPAAQPVIGCDQQFPSKGMRFGEVIEITREVRVKRASGTECTDDRSAHKLWERTITIDDVNGATVLRAHIAETETEPRCFADEGGVTRRVVSDPVRERDVRAAQPGSATEGRDLFLVGEKALGPLGGETGGIGEAIGRLAGEPLPGFVFPQILRVAAPTPSGDFDRYAVTLQGRTKIVGAGTYGIFVAFVTGELVVRKADRALVELTLAGWHVEEDGTTGTGDADGRPHVTEIVRSRVKLRVTRDCFRTPLAPATRD